MSELIDAQAKGRDFRRYLLTTASGLALMASVCGERPAGASDDGTDRPTVWIELGGQLERMDSPQVPFAPSFFDTIVKGGFESPLEAGRSSIYSNGGEGTISFMPSGSDWVFSGSLRYGRSDGHRFLHQQFKTLVSHETISGHPITATHSPNYAQTTANNSATHVIVDFQAGEDVGLGMFGGESTSTISAGVRFAQFNAKSNILIYARPDGHFAPATFYGFHLNLPRYHEYFGSAQRAVSFKGIGPSVSWKGSTPLLGNLQDGEITLDWGANAAVLFGKQKARTHYHTYGTYFYHRSGNDFYHQLLPTHHGSGNRSRSVVVPNIGGFGGLSFGLSNVKVSLGYRADFFFGAMDGGLDTARKENQGFYGPFATISVGLGG